MFDIFNPGRIGLAEVSVRIRSLLSKFEGRELAEEGSTNIEKDKDATPFSKLVRLVNNIR